MRDTFTGANGLYDHEMLKYGDHIFEVRVWDENCTIYRQKSGRMFVHTLPVGTCKSHRRTSHLLYCTAFRPGVPGPNSIQ